MRVAVVGGAGFVGGHVVDKLIAAGHDVVVMDRVPSERANHRLVTVTYAKSIDRAFREDRPEVVMHLAAVSNTQAALNDPVECFQVNVMGTLNVLEAARKTGVKHVVLAGSSLVSTALEEDEFSEMRGEWSPVTLQKVTHPYVASKLAVEMLANTYSTKYDLPVTVLRYGIMYGPNMTPGVVAHSFVTNALKGEPLVIHGDGSQWRQYVYVEDIADAHVNVLERIGRTVRLYNLVGSHQVSIREMAETVAELVPGTTIEYGPPRSGDIGVTFCSAGTARTGLGWMATTSLQDGLRKTVEWYRSGMEA